MPCGEPTSHGQQGRLARRAEIDDALRRALDAGRSHASAYGDYCHLQNIVTMPLCADTPVPPGHLAYRRPGQHHIHVRGFKEMGNINTPLELAIRNQTDRFSLAIDAIDRIPRFSEVASGFREDLLNEQVRCRNDAYEFGVDRPDIMDWKWTFGAPAKG